MIPGLQWRFFYDRMDASFTEERRIMEIYLDNSATTAVCPAAKEAAARAMDLCYGNPSALHHKGMEAKLLLEDARKSASSLLGASPEEVYFSHSGTLANNTAVFGAAEAGKRRGSRIVTTAAEHPSVGRCMDALEAQGFEVIRLAPERDGGFSPEALMEAVNEKTILVSAMLVNNETGAVNNVALLKKAVRLANAPALIHTDAVQGFGKLPVNPAKLGVDLLTASGHKLHAPKGVGLLYVRKGVKIKPLVLGGGQENGLFSGTEPLPAIAGFGAALRALPPDLHQAEMQKKNAYLRALLAALPQVEINSPENAMPFILNLSVRGIPSQVLINYLSERGIFVSAGSACKRGHRSEVLTAMGLPPERIDSAIRVSMSRDTAETELDAFADALRSAVRTLRTKL